MYTYSPLFRIQPTGKAKSFHLLDCGLKWQIEVSKLRQVTLWSKYFVTLTCTTGGHHCGRECLGVKVCKICKYQIFCNRKLKSNNNVFCSGKFCHKCINSKDVSFSVETKKRHKQTQSNLHWNNGSVWQANDRHIKDASSHTVLALLQYCANNNIL